jgi:hypothetical protein
MWKLQGKPAPGRLLALDPIEVLYEFDGPRIFTVLDSEGELDLAYWCDGDEERWRYVIVPTTPKIVAALRAGKISVWDALDQPRCWLCDSDRQGHIVECRRVDFDSIPRDALPAAGTMLLPTHVPILEPVPARSESPIAR